MDTKWKGRIQILSFVIHLYHTEKQITTWISSFFTLLIRNLITNIDERKTIIIPSTRPNFNDLYGARALPDSKTSIILPVPDESGFVSAYKHLDGAWLMGCNHHIYGVEFHCLVSRFIGNIEICTCT